MIKRKDKTVKQLQAECRKRKIGFMMNWTKPALIKRLEDEDNREEQLTQATQRVEDLEISIKSSTDFVQKESKEKIKLVEERAREEIEAAVEKQEAADRRLREKPQKIIEALDNELIIAQEEFDKLLVQTEVLNEKKQILGKMFVKAQKRVHLAEEAIETIKRITLDGELFKV